MSLQYLHKTKHIQYNLKFFQLIVDLLIISPLNNDTLKCSHFCTKLQFLFVPDISPKAMVTQKKQNRNIIWYNPPFRKKHKNKVTYKNFPKIKQLTHDFLMTTLSMSCCMDKMRSTIMKHNHEAQFLDSLKKKNPKRNKLQKQRRANLEGKNQCLLQGNCLISNTSYKDKGFSACQGKQEIAMTRNILYLKNNLYLIQNISKITNIATI